MEEKDLTIKENELVIDKNTKLLLIGNRKKYTKLKISKKVNPLILTGFNNVREITIEDNDNKYLYCYNEQKINIIPLIDNIDKIIYKNIRKIGITTREWADREFTLNAPNLKSIEIPATTYRMSSKYFDNSKLLEEIIFNVTKDTNINFGANSKDILDISNCNLKRIIIKTNFNTYSIILDYKPNYISKLQYSGTEGIILEYSDSSIETNVIIKNDGIIKENKLKILSDSFINDGCFYIPDYINNIDIGSIEYSSKIDSISLNLKHLSTNPSILNTYIPNLKSVIIRNDNDMLLFKTKEFTSSEYGQINKVYIYNKKLHIIFEDHKIIIDEYGNKKITSIEERIDEIKEGETPKEELEITNKINHLDNFTSHQLEYYTYYKKILEYLSNDNKLSSETEQAMSIIKKELVKKLENSEWED